MVSKEQTILIALLKSEKITFRALQKGTKISPRILKHYLDWLLKKNLIKKEEVAQGKRGMPHLYSLTEKGREESVHAAFESLNENTRALNQSFQVISELSDKILSTPDLFEEWRRASGEAMLNVEITESMSLEERIKKMETESMRIYGPLKESYKNMHRLICQLVLWKSPIDPMKVFIGFTSQGGLHMIPAAILKEKGYDLL
jgi:predicted ArsR family transcriptional regulator